MADKTQLAAYRAQLRDLRQRGQALRQSLRPTGEATQARPALTDAQRQQVQQLRAEGQTIRQHVAQLARKYEAAIAQLAQEIAPQKARWQADIQALAGKNVSPEQRVPRGRHSLSALDKPARFLLLEVPTPASATPVAASSTVFPNPAVSTAQLEFAVKKAGPVTVEVLDGRGTVLRTLVQNEPREKGLHTVSTSVEELPAGTYFYKITTRTGVETQRFVRQ
jgi:hypothetical protein